MSRLDNSVRNARASLINDIGSGIMLFVTRQIFIWKLSSAELGVVSLFSQVISILSISDLGLSSAICLLLYEPIAKHDRSRIVALVCFFKKMYRIIAIVIFLLGMLLVPFLNYLAPGAEAIQLEWVLVLYLIGALGPYLIGYRAVLIEACQKQFVISRMAFIATIISSLLQIYILLAYQNFYLYLIIFAAFEWVKHIYIYIYVGKNYPYIKQNKAISKNDLFLVRKKVGGLVWNKIGKALVGQTDNIIISMGLNVAFVAYASNYAMVISTASKVINNLLNASTASFGDLYVADEKKFYKMFLVYNFMGLALGSFSSLVMAVCFQNFIGWYAGEEYILPDFVVAIIIINFYLVIARTPAYYAKLAAGVVDVDWWIYPVEACVNLGVSIAGVMKIGIAGVYVGTIISGLVNHIFTGYYLYRVALDRPVTSYYIKLLKNGLCTLAIFICFSKIKATFMVKSMIFTDVFLLLVLFILLYMCFYFMDDEVKDIVMFMKQKIVSKDKVKND